MKNFMFFYGYPHEIWVKIQAKFPWQFTDNNQIKWFFWKEPILTDCYVFNTKKFSIAFKPQFPRCFEILRRFNV